MAEQRKVYSAECTQEAVRLMTDHHDGVAETARHLGSNGHRLRRWKQEYPAHVSPAFPGNGQRTSAQEALRQLRDEVNRLRPVRPIKGSWPTRAGAVV
jgi:transposase-like protein